MKRLFYASEVAKARLSPEASFRLQILLLPQIPNWHCPSKREKKGQAAKKGGKPPNWASSLSHKLAPAVRGAGHQIYVGASGARGRL